MEPLAPLAGLFAAAFLAATPLPMNSEIPFVALVVAGLGPVGLVIVASVGNVVGSVVTWAAGRGLVGGWMARWFRVPHERLARAEAWFARRGRWVLLLAWAPGGDFLCLAAGAMKLPMRIFLPLVALGKTLRYAVLAAITLGVIG